MASPATTDDIASRWRSLTPSEETIASTRLEDAWRKLKRDSANIETRMASDEDLAADVVRVLADAVIRLLQSVGREGLRRGSFGVDDATESWELDSSLRQGLYFTDDELADLSADGTGSARAFSVIPS